MRHPDEILKFRFVIPFGDLIIDLLIFAARRRGLRRINRVRRKTPRWAPDDWVLNGSCYILRLKI